MGAAVLDASPDPVRVMAADPSMGLLPEDLDRLPPLSDTDRQLAELSLHMATGPRGDHCGDADPAATARDAADWRFALAPTGKRAWWKTAIPRRCASACGEQRGRNFGPRCCRRPANSSTR